MILPYLKYGALLAAVIGLFSAGFYMGGERSKTALESFKEAQAQNTAKAVLAERAAQQTEFDRVNKIVEDYQNAQITPVGVTVVSRLLQSACPANGAVSQTSPAPGGVAGAGQESSQTGRIAEALTDYIAACSDDARRLNAVLAAWPK